MRPCGTAGAALLALLAAHFQASPALEEKKGKGEPRRRPALRPAFLFPEDRRISNRDRGRNRTFAAGPDEPAAAEAGRLRARAAGCGLSVGATVGQLLSSLNWHPAQGQRPRGKLGARPGRGGRGPPVPGAPTRAPCWSARGVGGGRGCAPEGLGRRRRTCGNPSTLLGPPNGPPCPLHTGWVSHVSRLAGPAHRPLRALYRVWSGSLELGGWENLFLTLHYLWLPGREEFVSS